MKVKDHGFPAAARAWSRFGQQTSEIAWLNHGASTRPEAEKPDERGNPEPAVVHVATLEVAVTPEVAGFESRRSRKIPGNQHVVLSH